MGTMISEVYDALKEAGASEDKARKAAEAIAGYEDRFRRIEERLTRVEERLTMLQWMIGFNLAMTVAILWKVFAD
ncbi:MAG: integrase [Candidatus Binatia bacterium]